MNIKEKRVIDWLLEENNPSVRYVTLRDLLNRKERSSEVKAAKRAISTSKTITKIFSQQNAKGYWLDPLSPYHPKYKASYWQVMILSQLGLDKTDTRIKKACEHILRFQHSEGGFSGDTKKTARREYNWRLKRGKQLPSFKKWLRIKIYEGQMSCLTGNIVTALIKLGYRNDPHVKRALTWLVGVQNKDGGWLCPYWHAHIRDTHSCFMGTICPLDAFSMVPEKYRSKKMKQAIKKGAEFLLMHHLFQADHHNFKIINRAWLELTFPYFFYNIVRGLDVLTRLGYTNDERLNDAINILLQKRDKDGTWKLENAPVGRMHTNVETVGKPSKWITFIACRILKSVQER
jgi:hypothetical protein